MGTRADFYVVRGESAEWLGSIAWDGYETSEAIESATTEQEYRKAVSDFLSARDDATLPEQGWPWPWDDSGLTDYAYAFDGITWATFGGPWWPASEPEPDMDDLQGDPPVWPDMSGRSNVTLGGRSGLMIFPG